MPSALLIDLDDTLLDDRGAMANAVLRFRDSHALARDEDDASLVALWDEAGRVLWRRLSLGELTLQEQRRIRLRQVFRLDLSDQAADGLFADYLMLYEQSWQLLPGAEDFLAATAHLRRVIMTNGHRLQAQRKLQKCGLENHFMALVTPEDCGARKPSPTIR